MIVTSDAPLHLQSIRLLQRSLQRDPKTILQFCGFNPVKLTAIGR